MLASLFTARYLPDLIGLAVVTAVQSIWALWMLRSEPAQKSPAVRQMVVAGWSLSMAALALGFLLRFSRVARHFPAWASGWGRGVIFVWAFLSVLLAGTSAIVYLVRNRDAGHSPQRRRFLASASWAVLGAPVAITGYGTFIQRFQLRMREQDIRIPGLPADLDGLRIAQLTDIHLSPYLSVQDLGRAVAMANEAKPNLTLVTGDLITQAGDPLDDCLRALRELKSDAGVYGCMGNHEIFARAEAYVQREGAKMGMMFLRQQSRLLTFGAATLNLAGVDYQRFHKPYLKGAEALLAPGAFNVLLSHNPDVFPVAAAKGFPLTISGHTHGGQVRVEILGEDLNIARFFTHYVDGLYEKNGSSVFVSRGIGTIGLPTRLGAPPEVALLKLCRS